MSVSYLLITTAWLAGAEPVPVSQNDVKDAKDKAPPKVVVHSGHGSCCASSCCDDNWRTRLRDRLRGLFRRDRDCCNPCPAHHDCGRTRLFGGRSDSCCSSRSACCEPSWRERLRDRCRGLFSRRDCCNPCPHPCGPTGTKAEQIPLPKDKKMPKGTEPNKDDTRLLNPGVPQIPFNTPSLQTPPLAPALPPGNLDRRERDF